MNDQKTQSMIENASFYDIAQYLEANQNLLHQCKEKLIDRFQGVHLSIDADRSSKKYIIVSDLDKLVNAIFTSREQITDTEIELLQTLASSIFDRMEASLSDEFVQYRQTQILMITCAPLEKLLQEDEIIISSVEQYLYKVILDLYYPTSNVSELILGIRNIVSLRRILENINDTQWFEERFIHSCSQLWYQDCIILFKYISDIFLNKDALKDFLCKYHQMIRNTYAYQTEFDKISERYSKFVGENEAPTIVTECMRVLESDNIQEELPHFLAASPVNKMPYKVFECMIYNAEYLLDTIHHPAPNLKYVLESAKSYWDDPSAMVTLEAKREKRKRANDEGKAVPEVCDKCGAKVGLFFRGEPVWVCSNKKCNKYYGTLPFPNKSANESDITIATEAKKTNVSVKMNQAERKIYKAYRTYKSAEEKVDSQITKAVSGMKNVLTGDVRSEIIEGKKFSAIGLLKRVLGTVGLFSLGPVKAVITLVVGYALKKSTTISEREKIIMELDTEIEMITEKIQDAKSDNNREAKYAMMRTKRELENARQRIQYGLEADNKSVAGAKAVLNNVKNKL